MAKRSWQDDRRIESKLASGIEIDMMVARHPQIVILWNDWCGWREELALMEKTKPWTPRAARIEMQNIARALERHSPDDVCAQIRRAIVGCWNATHVDDIGSGNGNNRTNLQAQQPW